MSNLSRQNPQLTRRGVWSPFGLMDEMLRWDPFAGELLERNLASSRLSVSFDVKETPEHYVIVADLPGVKSEDVNVTLQKGVLTITGKREEQTRSEGERYFTSERTFGSFARSFRLPEGVSEDDVNAALKDGVLTLHVKKPGEVQPKAIKVNG